MTSTCSLDGCVRTHKAQGLCETHYRRLQRNGNPGSAKIVSPGQGLAARFWVKVNKNGPIPTACPELGRCWIWTAAAKEGGYGVMRPEGQRTGPTVKAHRVSLILAGRDPGDLKVLHSCDNPPCVNPAHLRPGSQAENMRDALDRNRIAVGSRVWSAKLTEAAVVEIWQLIDSGAAVGYIAARYGVKPGTIYHIRRGDTWRHVARSGAGVAA